MMRLARPTMAVILNDLSVNWSLGATVDGGNAIRKAVADSKPSLIQNSKLGVGHDLHGGMASPLTPGSRRVWQHAGDYAETRQLCIIPSHNPLVQLT
jgi:hypothetical protein